jgi:RNA polymerase sigma factor (TIGR02999 family)
MVSSQMITPKQEEQSGDLQTKVYDELRKLAAAQMSRGQDPSTLQPTALVHEAWLRLGGTDQPSWQNRAHFFAAAAEAMRNILIDRARRRRAIRHGGDQTRVNVDDVDIEAQQDDERLIGLNEAIERLAAEHPRMAELVKLRCFAGFDVNQAAHTLNISPATAHRWWLFARSWLYRELHS